MLTTTQTITKPIDNEDWVCTGSSGYRYRCRRVGAGWQVICAHEKLAVLALADRLPNTRAALALLWQQVLQHETSLQQINTALLPDDSQVLKQIMGRLKQMPLVTLEYWHLHAYHSKSGLELLSALALLNTPQPLFMGAVNGPTYPYHRIVNTDTDVLIAEWGDSTIPERRKQLCSAARALYTSSSEHIPDDVLPELDDEYM